MAEQKQFRTIIILVAMKMLAWGWRASDAKSDIFHDFVRELNSQVDVDLVIEEMKQIEIDCLL